MALLTVNKIYKSFGKTQVLKGIDFSLEEGQVLAIIGSSGSGKTTLLRCIGFLETADSGSVTINGNTIFELGKWLCTYRRSQKVCPVRQDSLLRKNRKRMRGAV